MNNDDERDSSEEEWQANDAAQEAAGELLAEVIAEEATGDIVWHRSTLDTVNAWLTRGDTVAVYRNADLSSATRGLRQFVPIGQGEDIPPHAPDSSAGLGWRYLLDFTYRGPVLSAEVPNPRDLRNFVTRPDVYDIRDMRWSAVLDNHPVPRSRASGYAQTYSTRDDDVKGALILWDHSAFRDAVNAFYLIDDRRTVRAYRVASWRPISREDMTPDPDGYLILYPFPVEYTENGDRLMRADGRGPIDYGEGLGPRRAYHLKVTREGDA